MIQKFVVGLALAAAWASTALSAETGYKDPAGRFEVSVPEGWQVARSDRGRPALIMVREASATSGPSICIVDVQATPDTRATSDDELQAALDQTLTTQYWTENLRGAPGLDVTVESSGKATYPGRRAHFVVFTMRQSGVAGSTEVTTKNVLFAFPGVVHSIGCGVQKSQYASMLPVFEQVFVSYIPRRLELTAEAETRSVLVLSQRRDDAELAARLTHDTPNVSGLVDGPVVARVSGDDAWEVCDGAAFTGACRRVEKGVTIAADLPVRIVSARRVKQASTIADLGDLSFLAGAIQHEISARTH